VKSARRLSSSSSMPDWPDFHTGEPDSRTRGPTPQRWCATSRSAVVSGHHTLERSVAHARARKSRPQRSRPGTPLCSSQASDTPMIAIELTRRARRPPGLPPQVITHDHRQGEPDRRRARRLERDRRDHLHGFHGCRPSTCSGGFAGRNIRVQCEMGGKNAAIVARRRRPGSRRTNDRGLAGFRAGRPTVHGRRGRVLVDASVKDAFVERLGDDRQLHDPRPEPRSGHCRWTPW